MILFTLFYFFNFQEVRRHVGKLAFLYESEVLTWSKADLNFSYTVSRKILLPSFILFL